MLQPDSGQSEAALRLLLWRPPPTALDFLEGVFLNAVDGTPGLGVSMARSLLRGLPKEQVDERLDAVLPGLLAQLNSDHVTSLSSILVEFGMIRHLPTVADWLESNGPPEDQAIAVRLRNNPRAPAFWRRSPEDIARQKEGRAPGVSG